ncbi:hypothetical protein LX32DRAFT_639121 [Colletotrichum zoysiae]|uniref:Uncharacterized protein n=1 Tax=Colletotrichum zoysiae TaxID=1216348 RepID=A0AAD9M5A7_9PEZI|nr:hypothetical protein LX32DRAFT_639121 [Colletotrichum zoysiae]
MALIDTARGPSSEAPMHAWGMPSLMTTILGMVMMANWWYRGGRKDRISFTKTP